MYKRKRLNGYYVLARVEKQMFISHQPRWLFYFADKKKFFQKRKEAYEKLVSLLQDQDFWRKETRVRARSLTIDYSLETVHVKRVPLKWYDKPGLVMLWFFNLYNWRPNRLRKLMKVLRAKDVLQIDVDRKTFVQIYGRG
ncbi:hypothetical protein DNHGIG_39940 [Collibacillus ludicampi]|uniref:Uncharacterized protein n=1 Tax=Collibacillus ludicampi TaxID=2771369 RepID=A0AAV4LLA4_9BACL|nr:hypothetical protein [Collibacillus ludicampi]GIM48445.1 hypothetical protein DNHGIG_39940 [Collibacillus ludicampi]